VDRRAGLDDVGSKNSCPHRDWNCDLSVVQPVASRYTDCAIPAYIMAEGLCKYVCVSLSLSISLPVESSRSPLSIREPVSLQRQISSVSFFVTRENDYHI
jgi:hypothetical protein